MASSKLLCTAIVETAVEDMVKVAKNTKSDLVELRFDFLKSQDLDEKAVEAFKKIGKPIISACMPSWEGGKFEGKEEERIAILQKTLPFSSYVTVELKTEPELRNALLESAKKANVKTIVSYHDFSSTPPVDKIREILKDEEKSGADIAKIAFMPKDYGDVITTMSVLREEVVKIPIIAISMGNVGKVSRIMGPMLGSYLTYASAAKGKESAAGQLTVDEILELMAILGDENE
jgi:3-dehydroquinate dehydratase-1